jgi:hypothetical protein
MSYPDVPAWVHPLFSAAVQVSRIQKSPSELPNQPFTTNSQTAPELLTVREVADLLKLSPDAITKRFENYPGVLNFGSEETRHKRRYSVLRIPRNVLDRYLLSVRVA